MLQRGQHETNLPEPSRSLPAGESVTTCGMPLQTMPAPFFKCKLCLVKRTCSHHKPHQQPVWAIVWPHSNNACPGTHWQVLQWGKRAATTDGLFVFFMSAFVGSGLVLSLWWVQINCTSLQKHQIDCTTFLSCRGMFCHPIHWAKREEDFTLWMGHRGSSGGVLVAEDFRQGQGCC